MAERILIITDVETDGQLVSTALRNVGFDTRVREGHVRAIDTIDTERIGLIVLDTRTQSAEAGELCKLARKSPRGAVIPILLLGTGKEAIKTSADAIAHGADLLFLVDTEIHQLVRKCIHYLGEPTIEPNTPQTESISHVASADVSTPTPIQPGTTSEWSELDRLMVSDSHQTLGELGPSKQTNPDLDLLVSRMAPEMDLPVDGSESMAGSDTTTTPDPSASHSAKTGLKVGHAVDLNERGLGTVLFTAQKLELPEAAKQAGLVKAAFDAVRYELEDAAGGVQLIESKINAEDYEAVMDLTQNYDGYMRKARVGRARCST